MIDHQTIRAILAQYEKFHWQLHHVLLTPETHAAIKGSSEVRFANVQIIESDINAIWFSRPATNGRVAFELRVLGNTPFALVDSADPDACEEDLIILFERVEDRMRARLSSQH